jgi:hypothetical protein
MSHDQQCRQMLANAAELARLQEAVDVAFRVRGRDAATHAAWQAAAAEFRERYDGLAFPGGSGTALARLEAGEPHAFDAAVAFVECRPYFFRSGYLRAMLLRRLKRLAPGTRHESRVAAIVEAERLRRSSRHRPSRRVG